MMNKKKYTEILKFSFFSIFIVVLIVILVCAGFDPSSRIKHMELLGIVLPLLTFLIPAVNINEFKQYEVEKIYWSRENILLQIVTIAINVPGIIYIWYEGYKDSVIPDTLEKLGKKVVEFLL